MVMTILDSANGSASVVQTDLDQWPFALCHVSQRAVFLGEADLVVLLRTDAIGLCQCQCQWGVLDLQECLGRWFVSIGIHMKVRVRDFPAEHCTVARWSMLFTSSVSAFNITADKCIQPACSHAQLVSYWRLIQNHKVLSDTEKQTGYSIWNVNTEMWAKPCGRKIRFINSEILTWLTCNRLQG